MTGLIAFLGWAILMAPFIEEFLFRGAFVRILADGLRTKKFAIPGLGWGKPSQIAIIFIVGTTFGIFHMSAGIPVVIALGLSLTWLRLLTGSVWPCVAVHLLWNVGISLVLLATL